jgi:PqqD family protein of HPr-rel-A system
MGEPSPGDQATPARVARVDERHEPAWSLVREADAVWHEWDGNAVVHHARSNDTHLVDATANRVLLALQRRSPQTAAQLAAALNVEFGSVFEVLETLESVDFVMRC